MPIRDLVGQFQEQKKKGKKPTKQNKTKPDEGNEVSRGLQLRAY